MPWAQKQLILIFSISHRLNATKLQRSVTIVKIWICNVHTFRMIQVHNIQRRFQYLRTIVTFATVAKSVSFRRLKIIPNQEFTEAGISRKRAQRACWQCRRKKCKCSTELPMCKRCRQFGYDCQYPPTKRATNKGAKYQLDDRISTPNPLEVLR
jgi:hypothetical protein